MVDTVSYAMKEPDRFKRGNGWKVNLFGKNSDVPKADLQAFRIDMNAGQVLDSHFHIVDQFQIFIAGSGTIGRDSTDIVTAHYADHHTGYGPLVAGPQGMSYLTLRSKTDAGLVKLSTPNVREQLKPTKRRHGVSSPVTLSIPPVMQHRAAPEIETVMEERPDSDGMTVKVYRLGASQEISAPETAGTGGYYIIVMNGALIHDGETLKPWSLLFVRHDEPAPVLRADIEGAEVMVAVFPLQDDWMRQVGEEAA
ncbi:hypothetical protein [Paracoccus litorisediminis]|uniref:Uncharacterized protein n=1 Tax=Paracoccus litorisediminis TaxID=2006130 RepID=A0A844HVP7_9RHOB|nr:hypothetical protein [Paracoccus litorisediminis]MTH61542.1 hypothetical protein [Paracoccus litorisediminis]